MFYVVKTPKFIKKWFLKYTWNKTRVKKELYLTFDDGPTPSITNWVLNELNIYNAKATFFCIGKNVQQYPEITQKIIKNGHTIGNHTQNHLNGWKTKTDIYVADVHKANQQISKLTNRLLFRPPYGKIKNSQANMLLNLGYKIILWDVLSADFDTTISEKKCLQNVLKNMTNGSIVVFHDSVKATEKVQYVLPKILHYFTEKGFEFKAL